MLFNSLAFLGFAGLFYLLWPAFRRRDLPRWSFITLASFVFYGWWDPRYLALMAASGLVDFFAALWIADRPRVRKVGLVVSLTANLGLLAAFKYAGFLARVRTWTKAGIRVVGFRPPSNAATFAAEERHSGFEEAAFSSRFREAGGLWIATDPDRYPCYDGSHLTEAGARAFSRDFAAALEAALH